MTNVIEQIRTRTKSLTEGTPVTAKEFLQFGSREAIDQALCRMAKRGELVRAGRGIYFAPVCGRFGVRPPSPEKAVLGIARLKNETVAPHGALAANRLGLSTQVPMTRIYLTSGKSRSLRIGNEVVELRHAPSQRLARPGQKSGDAIRALEWLGPKNAPEALTVLKGRLSKKDLEEIASERPLLPGWLAKEVSTGLVD